MTEDNGRVPDGTGLSQVGPSSSGSLAPSGFDPSREPGESIFFMPRCEISRRWGGDLDALLLDSAFRTYDECRSWYLQNLQTLWLYGVYPKEVYRFDENSGEPFDAIMGDMLGIGRIAVIGGREWDRQFACDNDGSPQGGDACGSVHDSAGPQDIAPTQSRSALKDRGEGR